MNNIRLPTHPDERGYATYEFPDYVIDDYRTSAGSGLFGIVVEYHSDSEEFSVFGSDQDGGEHDITHMFDIEDIIKLVE